MSSNSEKLTVGNHDTLTKATNTTKTKRAITAIESDQCIYPNASYESNQHHNCQFEEQISTIASNKNYSLNDLGNYEYDNYFTKNLLLSDFWKENKIHDTIYENLCENCGYGVFDAKGKYCNFCEFTFGSGNYQQQQDDEQKILLTARRVEVEEENNENIYENICEKCGEIYNCKECEACTKTTEITIKSKQEKFNKTSINENKTKSKKSKILSGIVGTLKRVRSRTDSNCSGSNSSITKNTNNNESNTSNNAKLKKLNIIHNVDGYDNVFRTQETFDLNRICELKRLQSNSDQHIYGKLRKSDEQLLLNFRNSGGSSVLKTSSIKLNGNSKSDTTLHRIQSFTRSSPSSQNDDGLKVNRTPFHRIRSAETEPHSAVVRVRHDHVIEWMTSLRYQIHDYAYLPNDSICSIKSIPSRNFSCCGLLYEIGSDIQLPSLRSPLITPPSTVTAGEDEEATLRSLFINDFDYTQMVDDFKRNLMEKQRSKRKAIYLKIDDDDNDNNDHEHNYTFRSSTINSLNSTLLRSTTSCCRRRYGFHENNRDSDFVSDLLNAFDSFLKRDANQNNDYNNPEVFVDNVIEVTTDNQNELKNILSIVPVSAVNTDIEVPLNSELSKQNRATKTTNVSNETHLIAVDPLIVTQKIDIIDLITNLSLSKSLNRIVLNYDKFLSEFLRAIDTERFVTCKFSQLLEIFHTLRLDTSLQFVSRKRSRKTNKTTNREIANTLTSSLPQPTPLPLPFPAQAPPPPFKSSASHSSMSVFVEVQQNNEEDNIYQPIWKFKTVGNPRESYVSESDYYDITVNDESSSLNAEDHGEWEIDDEFMFSTKIKETTTTAAAINSSNSDSECRSMTSTIISGSSKSLYGGLITDPYRNVCIIYSVTEPKIRAILYDYDSRRSCFYSASQPFNKNNKTVGGCVTLSTTARLNQKQQQNQQQQQQQEVQKQQVQMPFVVSPAPERRRSESYKNAFISDCVQAWKFMLLDTFYADDEEDMYVSEDEILKLKQIETEVVTGATLQRFKSVSSDNLLDIPQDKKSLGERFRNKLQRGVLKLNRSPKDKKGKLFSKRSDSTSLYLEDGVKPKYPIFAATLNDVEKDDYDENVPKFVVDCVEFIEHRDCIQSDGLYRASGNKVAIDDLKKKLSEMFVYDSKLLKNQDVHTVTGLLKSFFRELKTPLIPNEIYRKLPDNLVDSSNISVIKKVLQSIPQPSKGTLKYLLKHLQTVAYYSSENRMPASNLAIIWGPCILFSVSTSPFDIARMNTLTKVLIENYDAIFADNERLVN